MRKLTSLILPLLLIGVTAAAQETTAPPATVQADGVVLMRVKQKQDAVILKAAGAEADKVLHHGLYSVTDKDATPPGGTKHDYMSLAPYWWPNPKTPTGLPYIRRDGEHNPQASKIPDHQSMTKMAEDSYSLALAYYLTGKDAYAERAELLIRTWFLNPATAMTPNLQFAQAVLGVNSGRGTGIIESRHLLKVVDAVTLLSASPGWTPSDREGIQKWFTAYLTWLQTSTNGQDEAAARNNHGSWYDAQVAGIALFLGKKDVARQVVETAKTKRVDLQIEADGKQPLELERTRSFSYCIFNLSALMQVARIGQIAGVDLWSYQSPKGGSIRAALNFLVPYATATKKWPYQTITGFDAKGMRVPLALGAIQYKNPAYAAAAETLGDNSNAELLLLRYQAGSRP